MQGIMDLLMIFFPSNCLVCGKRVGNPKVVMCLECEMNLPKSGLEEGEGHPVIQIFGGRIPVRAGAALFKYEKGSAYQPLIHALKYHGNTRAGSYLGRLLGQKLKQGVFRQCDLLLPVPLHPRRLRQRGYNQSELIARGVSEIMEIPMLANVLRRTHYQHSQTSMSRQERFENMEKAFSLGRSVPDLHGKKILIIDDIVTTGATLEACCSLLLEHFDCSVYVATLSLA